MFKYSSCTEAGAKGDLEELKKMHLAGYRWDGRTTFFIAESGYLDCLKYAYENGCELWGNICYYAASEGHLDCLKYLYENGFPLSESALRETAIRGKIECFKYCFQNWNSPQEFWNIRFQLDRTIDKIDLDDPVWRKLLNINLKHNPILQNKVENKKKELDELKKVGKEVLENILPLDVINYCINVYL